MTYMLTLSRVLMKIAFRNLFLNRVKTLFMGGILTFGSFLIVFGLSLLSNVERTMKEGIIHSVSGHLQVYSENAKDDLSLFGSGFMGKEDVGEIQDFAELKKQISSHPNIQNVVPMGFEIALLGRGNEADDIFDSLRAALKSKDTSYIDERMENVKFYISNLKKELHEREKILSDKNTMDTYYHSIAETENESFWAKVRENDESSLQFLETKIAPISGEKPFVYLRYLGTDPQNFQKTFDKFKIVSGSMLPEGQRGILISHKINEDELKMVCARKFDLLHKKLANTHLKIESDPELKRHARELSLQHRPILMQLTNKDSLELRNELTQFFATEQTTVDVNTPLENLLKQFLIVDDKNFNSRYEAFYKFIAPKVKLYEIMTGETIVLRSYTKNGYVKSIPVKVYGVYSFTGLEDSDIAGSFNMVDLVTFRELFGQMTEESLKEIADIQKNMKHKAVDKEQAEAAFFGEESSIESEVKQKITPSDSEKIIAANSIPDQYDPSSMQKGLIINAAIFLKDESLLRQTQKDLEARLHGNSMKIVDWKQASGTVGQFVEIIRYVLLFGVGIILLVALVIINNSFMVATFERSVEIGTMRAMGAQRAFVGALFVSEAVALSLVSSLLGTFLAYSLLYYLHGVGIPSMHEVITFLFSGPRLYPTLEIRYAWIGPLTVTLLAGISSLYPALFAARISPAQAMQEKE